MDDPIGLADSLSQLYIKYLDSALPLRDDDLMRERRRLFMEPGALFREPLLEPVPRYEETETLAETCARYGFTPALPAFAARGLFPDGRRLYRHQIDALQAVLQDKRHLVVTTGTGSGKTECFFLPIFAALLEESATWQRERPRALRALLLYPLNALAEDQMVRLRRATDSVDEHGVPGARSWLDRYRQGHQFYFGRYTGHTPVAGPQSPSARARLRERKKALQRQLASLDEQLRQLASLHKQSQLRDLRYHFPSLDEDAAECWDRWTMQEAPPDIMVTNYSMLNIMLMRHIEDSIFKETHTWLAQDPWRRSPKTHPTPSRVFHLVVDELHSYRGTAGTEVAYLIRLLLHRLGIEPDSPQVRFLASSASLPDDEPGRKYLKEFFGVSVDPCNDKAFARAFAVISGAPVSPPPSQPRPLAGRAAAFVTFRDEWKQDQGTSVMALAQRLEVHPSRGPAPQVALHKVLADAQIPQALLEAHPRRPETPEELGERIFGAHAPREAVAGLVQALALARPEDNPEALAPLPLREHLFFRNVLGLWACTDPQCPEVEVVEQDAGRARMLGKLYRTPPASLRLWSACA